MHRFDHNEARKIYEGFYSDDLYKKLDFTVKDCLYGQVRAISDNVYREYNVPGVAYPRDIPSVMQRFVKNQEIITWDNATGMNPLYDQVDATHLRYGDMLFDAYQISKEHGFTYILDLIDELTPDEYEHKIKEDYKNNYSMFCLSLGWCYHIQQFLDQDDITDYDYVTFRQMDTWYWPIMDKQKVFNVFELYRNLVLMPPDFAPTTIPINDIPIAYVPAASHPAFPSATFLDSFFFMFNRASIKILKDTFFVDLLQEMEIVYKRHGKNTRFILGKPGTLAHIMYIKKNISAIDISKDTFCWIPSKRATSVTDYSRIERAVPAIEL